MRRFAPTLLLALGFATFASGCGLINAFSAPVEPDPTAEPDTPFECDDDEHDDGTGECAAAGECASGFDLAIEGGFCIRIETLAPIPVSGSIALHSATRVNGDEIVVVGGFDPVAGNADDGRMLLYSESEDRWEDVGGFQRFVHQAIATEDNVLVIGGAIEQTVGFVTSVTVDEDGATTANDAAAMSVPRETHTATLLDDGRIVVIGGGIDGAIPTGTIEVFDAIDDGNGKQWRQLATQLTMPVAHHTATLLDGSRILVAGGAQEVSLTSPVVDTAVIVDVDADTVESVGSMADPRAEHTATKRRDGSVLIVGGRDSNGNALASLEVFENGRFVQHRPDGIPTGRLAHQATLLSDDRVLLTGGAMPGPQGVFAATTLTVVDRDRNAFDLGNTAEGRAVHPVVRVGTDAIILVGGAGAAPFIDASTSNVVRVVVGR